MLKNVKLNAARNVLMHGGYQAVNGMPMPSTPTRAFTCAHMVRKKAVGMS
jgi:hypothetical protein